MFRYPEFPIENHEIRTEDGYILSLQRINYRPERKTRPTDTGEFDVTKDLKEETKNVQENQITPSVDESDRVKVPVLMVHGFVCNADQWCLNSPDKVLPYELAQEGFDCWLANLRGTPLSKNHVSMSSSDKQYWDFSFHEMGLFDIPAIINHILEVNGSSSLYYIGHSMGCTVYFTSMCLHPEYNSKIKAMIALAPAMYGKYMPSLPVRLGIPVANFFGRFKSVYRKPTLELSSQGLGKKICLPFGNAEKMGNWVLRRIGGLGGFGKFGEQIEKDRIPKIAATYPASTSVKVFTHGNQCFKADKLQYYNYGRSGNVKRYGQNEPPLYDLKNAIAPVAIFYSEYDKLCSPKDIKRLADELPNLIDFIGVAHPRFSHMDFLLGKDSNTLVHHQVIKILQKTDL